MITATRKIVGIGRGNNGPQARACPDRRYRSCYKSQNLIKSDIKAADIIDTRYAILIPTPQSLI